MLGNASGSTEKAKWQGKDPNTQILFTELDIDYDLAEVLGIQLKEGRSFSKDFSSDSSAIILNESAIAAMGMKDPIGKTFDVWEVKYHIIGVTKDFHFESLHEKVKPCFMRLNQAGGNILVKVIGGNEQAVIARLTNMYTEYNPGFPFEFSFMDKDYEAMYISEQRESVLLSWFTALAIVISCLGLFGLAAFSAQKRQKEMSIRKVVGASTGTIAVLLSKDFFKLVLVAVLIAFPFSWWIMNLWLDNFAYRVSIDAGVFLLSFVAIIAITIITVSFQLIKAAITNPIKSLRTE